MSPCEKFEIKVENDDLEKRANNLTKGITNSILAALIIPLFLFSTQGIAQETDFEEGKRLRKSGIKSTIIVANPSNKSFNAIIDNQLDIVIHNNDLLEYYISKKTSINVHVKFNTGMNRYGFNPDDVRPVGLALKKNSFLRVKSICSHLSCSEDLYKKDLTKKQIHLFKELCDDFQNIIGEKIKRHILNSNGLINYAEDQLDMVRIGIALFGSAADKNLCPISSLSSVISENRDINIGDSIGYGSAFTANKKMNISIVPVGYADGLNRRLGNYRGEVIISNQACPIIGNISMDSFIVDTSNIDCKIGDRVEIFGQKNSVITLSKKLETIPYEIYATINRRIKRVYFDN